MEVVVSCEFNRSWKTFWQRVLSQCDMKRTIEISIDCGHWKCINLPGRQTHVLCPAKFDEAE